MVDFQAWTNSSPQCIHASTTPIQHTPPPKLTHRHCVATSTLSLSSLLHFGSHRFSCRISASMIKLSAKLRMLCYYCHYGRLMLRQWQRQWRRIASRGRIERQKTIQYRYMSSVYGLLPPSSSFPCCSFATISLLLICLDRLLLSI